MRKYANTGDGLLTALHLISEMARSKMSLKRLSTFMTRYPQVLINVSGVSKAKLDGNETIQNAVKAAEQQLGDKGRVLLRKSGTEPLVRVMIEAQDDALAKNLAESLADLVKSELS